VTLKQQIFKILKEESRPLKAREISNKFPMYFNQRITRREINRIIHHQMKDEVKSTGFPKYKYYLTETAFKKVNSEKPLNKQYIKHEDINFNHSNTRSSLEEISPSEKVYKLIDEYRIDFYKFRRTKDNTIRDNCLLKIEEIVEYIVSNNLNIDELSKHLEKAELIHKQIIGHKRIIKIIKEKGLENNLIDNNFKSSSLNSDLKVLIQKYESTYSDFIKLNRKPSNIKSTFSDLIDELEKQSSNILDLIAQNILKNNTSLTNLENNCSSRLYNKIENHQDIYNWINKKDEDHLIEEDSYEDRLKEFKILCTKVWEDGIIDKDEQIEINKKIKELNLDPQDANEIFESYNKKWCVKIDNSIEENIKIDYINKQISFKNINLSKEELLINFIDNLFNERLKHRSLEVDLLFENFEEFYE
tara:strand:+ start:8990 stop:10240 length:1251 start_codon:yes stop_codon:yes gene_type:complete